MNRQSFAKGQRKTPLELKMLPADEPHMPGVISFRTNSNISVLGETMGDEMIRLCPSGNIYVKGKLVENDMDVVDGMRRMLNLQQPWGDEA